MKTKYKFIHFENVDIDIWICWNNKTDDVLGRIEYYITWKSYIFIPETDTVFSGSCLLDIADFMKQLESEAGDE